MGEGDFDKKKLSYEWAWTFSKTSQLHLLVDLLFSWSLKGCGSS